MWFSYFHGPFFSVNRQIFILQLGAHLCRCFRLCVAGNSNQVLDEISKMPNTTLSGYTVEEDSSKTCVSIFFFLLLFLNARFPKQLFSVMFDISFIGIPMIRCVNISERFISVSFCRHLYVGFHSDKKREKKKRKRCRRWKEVIRNRKIFVKVCKLVFVVWEYKSKCSLLDAILAVIYVYLAFEGLWQHIIFLRINLC